MAKEIKFTDDELKSVSDLQVKYSQVTNKFGQLAIAKLQHQSLIEWQDKVAKVMKDEDEVLLWPLRFDSRSTNPWDHDDFGGDDNLANPNNPLTGPDAIDNDDDNDS